MTDGSGRDSQGAEDWEELEPQRVWTAADRWRLAAWVLVFANLLGVLMLAPVGDGGLVQAAEAAGTDDGPARLTYWVTVLVATLVGNAIGAAAAATKRRWAIVPPLLAAAVCWIAFFVAQAMV
ncbi:hypothetical protein [Agrococcus sp. ARC_14]|uniref:hypothetical protein n=1 Tax=Agrococcus sp. ARC_14 TaxID=2919927 RepID=UPI001F06DAC5|nr:hypothetical protein [Agrococcus sp. ARC_14]MCH1881977.1 hypothetical protein [Agrococcus sp. ARC_14]